ncbi:hypothetical protein [Paraburkholderia ferrariae]|uniref:Uncharacterized protein n=1 Tax=Paraburkholderia ferrariae TaxID=386056 RepID=A0ABU9RYV2_9BURK
MRNVRDIVAPDVSAWPTVAYTEFDGDTRRVFEARLQAVLGHARGDSLTQIEQAAAPHAAKSERRARHTRALESRHDAMLADHSGACLTWARDAGWTVMDTIEPAELDLRRGRLFGFTGKHLWCWIYCTPDGHFVARLVGARLQAIGATPGDAIVALRRSAADYQRICHVALPHSPAVPLVRPEPMDPMLAEAITRSLAMSGTSAASGGRAQSWVMLHAVTSEPGSAARGTSSAGYSYPSCNFWRLRPLRSTGRAVLASQQGRTRRRSSH